MAGKEGTPTGHGLRGYSDAIYRRAKAEKGNWSASTVWANVGKRHMGLCYRQENWLAFIPRHALVQETMSLIPSVEDRNIVLLLL